MSVTSLYPFRPVTERERCMSVRTHLGMQGRALQKSVQGVRVSNSTHDGGESLNAPPLYNGHSHSSLKWFL